MIDIMNPFMFTSVISTDSDFSISAEFLSLDFIRIVPGARACATTSASSDSILEGPEVFGFQILQDTDLPDVVIFHNDIRVILNDDGMTMHSIRECYCGQLSLPQACAVQACRQGIMPVYTWFGLLDLNFCCS